jgi:tetratricopeptide (TPR) repeat protein
MEYYRAIVNLGWCAFNQGRYKEALYDYNIALPYYEHIRDTTHLAMIYRMTGYNYARQGYSDSAFYFFQKNGKLQKKTDDINGIIHTTEFKGNMYLIAGDTAKAISFYLQSAELAKAKKVVSNHDYPSMFLVYKLKHEYDSALSYFQQDIYLTRSSSNDSFLTAKNLMHAYEDIAELHLMMNNYNETIAYCQQPLKAFRSGGAVNELMTILKYLAMAYERKHEDAIALKFTNQLLQYAKKSEAKPGLRDAYMILWGIYDRNHRIDLAYKYHLKYTTLNESIENADYKAKIAAWDAITKITEEDENYNAQLKLAEERNNAELALLNKQKQLQLYIFISVFVAGLLLVTTFVRNLKLKRRKDQLQLLMTEANVKAEQQKKETEIMQLQRQKIELQLQALRAQMNPHFIFNCLNSINRFIINNNAAAAADYLTKFARLIRIVLQQSGQSFIPLEDELHCLQLYMDLETLRFEIPFQYEINCNGIDIAVVSIPSLLLQPFVENAIWHGLHPKKTGHGKILINMQLNNDILHCQICDNGIGIIKSTVLKETIEYSRKELGIKLTQQRLQLIDPSKQHEVKITMYNTKNESGESAGTCVDIMIPIKEM